MDKQSQSLKTDLLRLTWYMRGGLTYSEILEMNAKERELIGSIIKENLETTKKTGLPYF